MGPCIFLNVFEVKFQVTPLPQCYQRGVEWGGFLGNSIPLVHTPNPFNLINNSHTLKKILTLISLMNWSSISQPDVIDSFVWMSKDTKRSSLIYAKTQHKRSIPLLLDSEYISQHWDTYLQLGNVVGGEQIYIKTQINKLPWIHLSI